MKAPCARETSWFISNQLYNRIRTNMKAVIEITILKSMLLILIMRYKDTFSGASMFSM